MSASLAALEQELLGREPLTGQVREPFHWVLAFPEVFGDDRQGFDAMVGNPPFLGGKKISGPFGSEYRDYLLHQIAQGTRGNADLCAYFYLRAHALVRAGGCFGFIATNTIAQGDTREVGLDRLSSANCAIYRAIPSRKWPGAANLEVAQTWLRLGSWRGAYTIDGRPTNGITSFLAKPGKVAGTPYPLAANAGKSYIGSYVLGLGFVLSEEEAQTLIARDPRNKQVLYPYLNGEDLNSSPTQSPRRWVINFHDWPLDHASKPPLYTGPVAADFPECLEIIIEKVKPERERNNRKTYRDYWWHFGEKRPAMYKAIEGQAFVLVASLVSKYLMLSPVRSDVVFSHMVGVIIEHTLSKLSILHASFYEYWVRVNGSSMRKDIRFTPSSCYETLPLPTNLERLAEPGQSYDEQRRRMMMAGQYGLTALYNRFHDKQDQDQEVKALRRLQVSMDEAVMAAYGWTDLRLNHGFHPTEQGQRFTIDPRVTEEILDRLLALNHERYAQEVAQGLHPKPKATPAIQPKPEPKPEQLELF